MTTKGGSFPVHFLWGAAKVGKFQPGVFVPEPALIVVYVMAEHIDNLDDVVQNKAEPILNVAGVHYCYLQLHDAMTLDPSDLSKMYSEPNKDDASDVGWGADDTEKWDE